MRPGRVAGAAGTSGAARLRSHSRSGYQEVSWRVVIAESGASFTAAPGESVLEAGLRQGIALKHECTFGGCGTCRVKLVEGRIAYEEMPLALTPEEHDAGYALLC